jgi:branched-chain amino acid transport system substrate-binding protein
MQFTTKLIPLALAMAFAGSAYAQQVVKIGAVAPMSGPNAHLGKDNDNAARMAIDELNAKGFTLGGKKVTLQLLSEDDASDPKQGTAVAQKLVDAHVAGVIGHLNSGTTVPASKIYNDAGIPQISPATTAPAYTRQHFPGAFRTVASDAKLGGTLAKYAIANLKVKNIAVIDDRTTYGQGVADEFLKGAKAPGVRVVGKEFTNPNATDYTAILTSIKAKKPDLVFFGGMDSVGGPMLKQMKALGINALYMGGDGICTESLGRLAGDAIGEGKVVCAEAGGVLGNHGGRDAEGEFGRPGQVPARAQEDQVRGRDRHHPVRAERRPEGRRADPVHLQGRQEEQDRSAALMRRAGRQLPAAGYL